MPDCPSDASVGFGRRECYGGIDFTEAFESYVLVLIPAACLLLLAPLRLHTIWTRTIKVVTPTLLQFIKSFSALAFVCFSFAVLVANCMLEPQDAEIAATVVAFSASVAAFVLSHWEHVRSVRPSKLLQIYLLVALIVQAVHLRSTWIRRQDTTLKVLAIGEVISCAVFLTAESAGKEHILLSRKRRSPQDTNGLFSEGLFWWLNHLFRRGYRTLLAPQDLDTIDGELVSPEIHRRFRMQWLKHYHRHNTVSLARVVFSALRYDLLFPIIPRTLLLAVNFAQPFLIERFIGYIEDTNGSSVEEGVLLVLATALEYTAIAVFQAWYRQSMVRFETKVRACLTISLHDKALRTRPDSTFSPLTLMNVEVERLLLGIRPLHDYWAFMFTLGVCLVLLYRQLGLVFLAPLLTVIILISISVTSGGNVAPKQKAWLAATQVRISYVTNVIGSMKNIKMLGIGPSVLSKGLFLRESEVDAQRSIRKALFLGSWLSNATLDLATFATYCGFGIRTRLGGEYLTTANLFTSLAVVKLFTPPMLEAIQAVPTTLQAWAAAHKIQAYLAMPEHHDTRTFGQHHNASTFANETNAEPDDQPIAKLTSSTCGYSMNDAVLHDINCTIWQGDLTFVIGSVGSGKSSFLRTLLGETTLLSGAVSIEDGQIAFCDQNPWLWNGTVAENICGAAPLDKDWFSRVTWACGLHDDFSQWPKGVLTAVGSQGTALSGGQKNRISLARALYSRAKIMVLDDTLSGLDNHTEKLVFTRVFGRYGLLKHLNTTVVLATHSVGWVHYADRIIVMSAGRMIFNGLPDFAPSPFSPADLYKRSMSPKRTKLQGEHSSLVLPDNLCDNDITQAPQDFGRRTDLKIYKKYMKSFGVLYSVIYLSLTVAWAAIDTLQSLWLKWWAAAEIPASARLDTYIGVFAVITLTNVGLKAYTIWFAVVDMVARSSLYLYKEQWQALVKVAYYSWGSQDTGSVANRFSQDIMLVDTQLGMAYVNTTVAIFVSLAGIGLIVVASPFVAAALPVVFAVFWLIQLVYLRTSKQLRIMDLEAKAPLCTHFLETVSGVATIKAYGWNQQYREKNNALLERSQVPFYLLKSVQNWLTLVLNLVVAGLATVIVGVAVKLQATTNAGYLGIALISIMSLGEYFEVLVQSWTMLETSMGAIARMSEFVDSMPGETEGTVTPPPAWLASGGIQIEHLTAAYSETTEPALKDISLTVKAGEHIAICGRTGSGKSSLASAVFGLLHIRGGRIAIDGIDITLVSQDLLRSKIVALPQEPFFRPGTVRDNLALRQSEIEAASDSSMLQALDKVGLKHKFERLADTSGTTWLTALDVELAPEDMLTKGQMQLFAMARAMLSLGQIVLVDEATSGLDPESDAMVQRLLREELGGRTIIAIAHRLRTILDFDTVVVLDNGRIAEQGCPAELQAKDESLFGQLFKAAE